MADQSSDPSEAGALDPSVLDEPSLRDTNLAVGRALLELVPFAGGFIAEILGNIPRQRELRQREFIRELAEALNDVQTDLDESFVRTDDFMDLAEDFFERTQSRREMEKIAYYAAALANAATPERPETAEMARMVDVLRELRPAHLRLLAVVATTTHGGPDGAMSVDQVLAGVLPEEPIERIRMDWADLARLNVLQGYPSGVMSPGAANDLTTRLTPFGQRFHQFVTRDRPTSRRAAAAVEAEG